MTDPAFDAYLTEVSSAVDAFVSRECRVLARRVVWHAMREKASGWLGGDYAYRSLWDEYCHFIQHDSGSRWAQLAEDAIEPIITNATGKLPQETRLLISLSRAFDTENFDDPPVGLRPDLITAAVREAVHSLAIDRDLDHLGPHRNERY